MKYFSITKSNTGKLNWLTVKLFVFEISIAVLGFKKFSVRLTVSYGW